MSTKSYFFTFFNNFPSSRLLYALVPLIVSSIQPSTHNSLRLQKLFISLGLLLPPRGTILDPSGNPAQKVVVELKETKFDTVVATRVTDLRGQYRFVISPGRYELTVRSHTLAHNPIIDTRHQTNGPTVINLDLRLLR